jgi:P4 family phage/plasmid primase-like protien
VKDRIAIRVLIRETDAEILEYYPQAKEGEEIIILHKELFLKKSQEGKILFLNTIDDPKLPSHEFAAKKVMEFNNYTGFATEFLTRNPIYYDDAGIYWVWVRHHHRYEIRDETHIMILIDSSLQWIRDSYLGQNTDMLNRIDTLKSNVKAQILEAIKRVSRTRRPAEIEWYHVQYHDKIYNLETGESFEASPKWFVTNPIPHKLGETDNTPKIDKLFQDWAGEKKVLLYELLAFCIVPRYFMSRIFWLVGEGSNGKSVFLRLTDTFIGEENIATTDLDTLIMSKFEKARLHKKLVCTIREIDGKNLEKTSILKNLSGGDKVGIEYKGKNPIQDYLYAKIVIAANVVPNTTDATLGWFRRYVEIKFPNQFKEEKDVLSDIPAEEYENLARKTFTILRVLIKTRRFTGEGTAEEKREMYESISDPLKKFMETEVEEDPNGQVYCWDFQKTFDGFCEMNGYRKLNERVIGKRVLNDFPDYHIMKSRITLSSDDGTKRPWVYTGIKWKTPDNTGIKGRILSLLEKNGNMEISQIESIISAPKERFDNAIIELRETGEIAEIKTGVYMILK